MTEILPGSGLLEAVFQGSSDAVLVVDVDGKVVAANPAAHELLLAEDLRGAAVEDFVPEDFRSVHVGHRKAYSERPRARRMGAGLQLVAKRRDGTRFPVDIALSPAEYEGRQCVVAAVRDITDLVEAQQELEESMAELAIMADRERIARDLHDTVIQDIFAAGLTLQAVQSGLGDPDAVKRVETAVDQLDSAIARLRRVIFDLRVRTGEGMTSSLERIVSRLLDGSGIDAKVTVRGRVDDLGQRLKEHVAATVREAVANVVRHAAARRMWVDVGADEEACTVEVRDDGTGIAGERRAGFGLGNMADRAGALGGTFSAGALEEGGTLVSWSVPLAQKTEPAGQA